MFLYPGYFQTAELFCFKRIPGKLWKHKITVNSKSIGENDPILQKTMFKWIKKMNQQFLISEFLTCRFLGFFFISSTEDTCGQPPEPSSCYAYFPTWYYNQKEGRCKLFTWGGCTKNDNHFNTEKECMQACKGFKGRFCFISSSKSSIPARVWLPSHR